MEVNRGGYCANCTQWHLKRSGKQVSEIPAQTCALETYVLICKYKELLNLVIIIPFLGGQNLVFITYITHNISRVPEGALWVGHKVDRRPNDLKMAGNCLMRTALDWLLWRRLYPANVSEFDDDEIYHYHRF